MKSVMLASAAIVATERAREGFAVAQERALNERNRADHDVLAADRNHELYRLTR